MVMCDWPFRQWGRLRYSERPMATVEADHEKLARHGLRYVSPGEPGYTRIRTGETFDYVDRFGRPLRPAELERVKALVIPPAWEEVWICGDEFGHIQATGVDAAGRKQYRYAARWRAMADGEKFEQMIRFARSLPLLRRYVRRGIARPDLDWDRMLCTAVRILDRAPLRVGFEEYMEENSTHGLATMLRSHVEVEGIDTIKLEFVGKASKPQITPIIDPLVVETYLRLREEDDSGTRLLSFREGDTFYDFKANDINGYLEAVLGERFTAKTFRTWHATKLSSRLLAAQTLPESERAQKRIKNRVVKETADKLGNTPAVCRSSYIDPRVFTRWENDQMGGLRQTMEEMGMALTRRVMSDRAQNQFENAVIEMLEGVGQPTLVDDLTGQVRLAVGAGRRDRELVSVS